MPSTSLNTVFLYPKNRLTKHSLPLFLSRVQAGFPSPADDYIEQSLDLNKLLIKKPAATFFFRASGEGMVHAGIHPNDILVVDRSLQARSNHVVVCVLNGELLIRRFIKTQHTIVLKTESTQSTTLKVYEHDDFVVWGVVQAVIHAL